MAKGVKHKFGSLEESLAIWALERENEIEFLKLLCVINGIISVGNNLAAVLSGSSEMLGSDNLSKLIDSLQEMMLPHRKEELGKKIEEYREVMEKEYERGPLEFHVVDHGKPKNRSKRSFSKVK